MQFKTLFRLAALLITQSLTSAVAGVPSFTSVGPAADPNCDFNSIQEAITATSETVHIVAAIYDENILIENSDETLVGGFLDCNAAELGIRVPGSMATVAPSAGVAFIGTAGKGAERDVTMTGLNFIEGDFSGFSPAGGLVVAGVINVALFESRIADNVGLLGGGVYVDPNASLFLRDTVVENNVAAAGGGIYCLGCSLTIDRGSSLFQNQAIGNEGGTIQADGGGLYANNGAQVLLFAGSKNPQSDHLGVHQNSAGQRGGGIYMNDAEIFIYGDDFFGFGNTTDPASITDNQAGVGAGIFATEGSTVNATAIDVRNNVASVRGGGFAITINSVLNINAVDLFNVGGCWNSKSAQCNRFLNNGIELPAEELIRGGGTPTTNSGAILIAGSTGNITNTWFEGNYAAENSLGSGAVIFAGESTVSIENSVMYDNGLSDDSNTSILRSYFSDVDMRFNTIADNHVEQHLFSVLGSPLFDFHVYNTIVHNQNAIDVLSAESDDADFEFNCLIVHEQASFNGYGTHIEVSVGDPMFFNRTAGDFNLYSASVLALDQCGIGGSPAPDFDLSLNARGLDLNGLGNDFAGFYDIGAIEFQGSDIDLDIIFANGFD